MAEQADTGELARPETAGGSLLRRSLRVVIELSSIASVVSFVVAAVILLVALETHRIPFGAVVGVNDIVTFGIGLLSRLLWFAALMAPALALTAGLGAALVEGVSRFTSAASFRSELYSRLGSWLLFLTVYLFVVPRLVDVYYLMGDDLVGLPPASGALAYFLAFRSLLGPMGPWFAYAVGAGALLGAFLLSRGVIDDRAHTRAEARRLAATVVVAASALGCVVVTGVLTFEKIDYELSVGVGWLEEVDAPTLRQSCQATEHPTVHWVGSEAMLVRCGYRFVLVRSPENGHVILRDSPVPMGGRRQTLPSR